MQFGKVTHVIFDLDGLLIDSESIYEKIISDLAEDYEEEYTTEMKVKSRGITELEKAKIAVKEMDLNVSPDDFVNYFMADRDQELRNTTLMPGVKELVTHLHKKEIPIAVATSSFKRSMEWKTENHEEIFELFHHIVCGDGDREVRNGKPGPDIYLVSASRFPDKPHPSQCLVFEDSPNGVKAAIAAGMQVVMVPAADVDEELRKPATIVLESLVEFKPELFGLPSKE